MHQLLLEPLCFRPLVGTLLKQDFSCSHQDNGSMWRHGRTSRERASESAFSLGLRNNQAVLIRNMALEGVCAANYDPYINVCCQTQTALASRRNDDRTIEEVRWRGIKSTNVKAVSFL